MLKRGQIDSNDYLLKQLPKATAFLNNKLEIIQVSDQWIKDFDLTNQELIGKKIYQVFENLGKGHINVMNECLKGVTNETIDKSFLDKEKNEKCFEWLHIPWYDDSENIVGIIIQAEDITQKVMTEMKLQKLEILLKTKSEIAKIGNWEFDAEKNSLSWCDMTKKIHAVPKDYCPNLDNAIEFYKEGHSKNTISMAIYDAMEKDTPWSEKLQIVTAEGHEKWILAAGKPLFKNDRLVGLIGTIQDIDEQVKSELKTKENEQLLKTLLDNLPLSVYLKDKESRKILVNKAECDFVGVDNPADIIGKDDFDIYDKKTAKQSRDQDLDVMTTLKPILGKEILRNNKDGTKNTYLISKIPLLNKDNEVDGIIGMSLDITEKRKAEKSLKEKERYFSSIFNSSYQFSGILDLDGTFLEINDTALEFASITSDKIIGEKFWNAYWWPVPDIVADGLKKVVKAAAKGETMRSELVVLDKNKNTVPVDFSLKPIYNENNKVVSLLAEGRMITEMVAAREKLKESEQKFRTLYEMSPVSFILYDFDSGSILDFNPSFENISGYNKNSIAKINFWDFLHNRNEQYKTQIKNQLEKNGTFGPFEEKLINKKGREYSVIINKSLIVNKKGEKLVWTIVQDISESEKKEQQIREERKLLKTLIDNLPLNVYIKDTQSRKILVNQAECDYLGVDNAKELLGKSDFDLYDKEVAQISRDEDLRIMKSLKPVLGVETTNKKKDGTITTFLTSKIPLKGEDGIVNGLVGISLDISELKQKEEELRSLINVTSLQNKKLLNFAHIVSHNLRSHSANFSMLLEFLVNERDESERENLVKMLVEASNNLLETLENLNEVLAINTNVNLKKKSIHLNKKINKVTDDLSDFLKNKKVKIINNIPDDVKIKAVPDYAESILMNFITNAVKFRSPDRDPIIELNTSKVNGNSVLSIKDNGLGIDLKKYGDKLFGMYKTFHINNESRGIGLYITKNQIEAMNGKITTKSEVGIGTTFNIYFNDKD